MKEGVSRVMSDEFTTASTSKRAKIEAILRHAWDSEVITASDLMAVTGLTRSTVIAACDELVAMGWLAELPNARSSGSDYRKGRPARRYELDANAGIVVGLDAGPHRIRATVADLRARILGESTHPADPEVTTVAQRRALADVAIDDALEAAQLPASLVLCLTVGVAAPVDNDGNSPHTLVDFWQRMNPDFVGHLEPRGWPVIIENDANLAALAEGVWGAGQGCGSYVTLVSGERFGAGYVLDGQLVRGAHGGAGELHLLDLVEGVGSANGLGAVARELVQELAASGRIPTDSRLSQIGADQLDAEQVFRAARQEDPAAVEVVDRLAHRLARICAVLAGLLDVERIIIAGAVARSLDLLLDRTRSQLDELTHTPAPEVVASGFGDGAVGFGAVARSLQYVREHALYIVPVGRASDV